MRHRGLGLPGFLVTLLGMVAGPAISEEITHTLLLGETEFEVIELSNGSSPWLICHVHDDERSAFEAAAEFLKDNPGRLVSLKNQERRELEFNWKHSAFHMDPNRMFSRSGIERFLRPKSAELEEEREIVEAFAKNLLKIYDLPQVKAVIAVHNNSPDAYSVLSYQMPGDLSRDAREVHIAEQEDPDDFFFVTDERLYRGLAERRRNVVLQDNSQVTNDGSLSVYCGQMGLPYVNIEAEAGHTKLQRVMMQEVIEVLMTNMDSASGSGITTSAEKDSNQRSENDVFLVDLVDVDKSWIISAQYAGHDNFMKRAFYPENRLFLEAGTAARLRRVQLSLARNGLGLKIWDAYRPLEVQQAMWEAMPDDRYVANPAHGSRHNRGAAVDVTLVDSSGKELEMPTEFDDFSEKAHHAYMGGSEVSLRNRTLLREAMTAEGFLPLSTEWWHYDAPNWREFPVLTKNPYRAK